jgi:hypothetical protein
MKKQFYISVLILYAEYKYGMSILYACYIYLSKEFISYVQSAYFGFLVDHINLSYGF